jgi:leucyl/phenylalanyl-tRNA--protein transferase
MIATPYTVVDWAEESGLVAVGGDLQPRRLLDAYRSGIFPWYDDGWPICWWSPDPRAIFELDGMHISHRLARTLRTSRFRVSLNQDFACVIRGCARGREEGTWITADMIEAYERLHDLGHAHSVEVWSGSQLAGGLYGVAIGGFFAGESMFTRVRDASKVALAHLLGHLRQRGYQLFDIQMLTNHTARLGAVEIPRAAYLGRLRRAIRCPATFQPAP